MCGKLSVFPLWLPYIHIWIAIVFKSHSRFKSKWCATLVSRKFSQHPYGWLFALSTEAACLTVFPLESVERGCGLFFLSAVCFLIAGLWTLSSLQWVMWAKSSPNSILLASHLACITVSLPISVASSLRSAFLSDSALLAVTTCWAKSLESCWNWALRSWHLETYFHCWVLHIF